MCVCMCVPRSGWVCEREREINKRAFIDCNNFFLHYLPQSVSKQSKVILNLQWNFSLSLSLFFITYYGMVVYPEGSGMWRVFFLFIWLASLHHGCVGKKLFLFFYVSYMLLWNSLKKKLLLFVPFFLVLLHFFFLSVVDIIYNSVENSNELKSLSKKFMSSMPVYVKVMSLF